MPRTCRLKVRVATCAFALVPLCSAALAQAQARIDVPEDCGSDDELRTELARLLGAEAAAVAMPERLRIRRDADGLYSLELQLRGERRALRDPDCRALFKTAVVITAAAVDPRVQPESVPGSRPNSGSESEPRSAPARSVPWRAGAWLGAGAAIALLPQLSPLFELSGTLARGDFGIALAGRYMTPADETASDAYGVRIHGFGARLAALYDPWPFARLQAGVALDHLSGRGLGSAVDDVSGSGAALALALEGAVIPLRAGQARLSLGIAGQYALVRPSFEVTGYGEVYRTPRIGATALVRLGWEFH